MNGRWRSPEAKPPVEVQLVDEWQLGDRVRQLPNGSVMLENGMIAVDRDDLMSAFGGDAPGYQPAPPTFRWPKHNRDETGRAPARRPRTTTENLRLAKRIAVGGLAVTAFAIGNNATYHFMGGQATAGHNYVSVQGFKDTAGAVHSISKVISVFGKVI